MKTPYDKELDDVAKEIEQVTAKLKEKQKQILDRCVAELCPYKIGQRVRLNHNDAKFWTGTIEKIEGRDDGLPCWGTDLGREFFGFHWTASVKRDNRYPCDDYDQLSPGDKYLFDYFEFHDEGSYSVELI